MFATLVCSIDVCFRLAAHCKCLADWFLPNSFRFQPSFRSDKLIHNSRTVSPEIWYGRGGAAACNGHSPGLARSTLTRFGRIEPEILGAPGVSSAFLVDKNTHKISVTRQHTLWSECKQGGNISRLQMLPAVETGQRKNLIWVILHTTHGKYVSTLRVFSSLKLWIHKVHQDCAGGHG